MLSQGRGYYVDGLLDIDGSAVYPDAADIIASGVIDNFLQPVFRCVLGRININVVSETLIHVDLQSIMLVE